MAPKLHRSVKSLTIQSIFPAKEKQTKRIDERKRAQHICVNVCGTKFEIFPGVYQTSVDTELMCAAVRLRGYEAVLEVGCGCGAITLLLAQKCLFAEGLDINPLAVKNARRNAEHLGITNVAFFASDVFDKVAGSYDVIVFNPPYNHSTVADPVERMFWDPNDDAKCRFFQEVGGYLKRDGRVYFGWADFADLDGTLPLRLAKSADLKYVRHYSAPAANGAQCFYVIELKHA